MIEIDPKREFASSRRVRFTYVVPGFRIHTWTRMDDFEEERHGAHRAIYRVLRAAVKKMERPK